VDFEDTVDIPPGYTAVAHIEGCMADHTGHIAVVVVVGMAGFVDTADSDCTGCIDLAVDIAAIAADNTVSFVDIVGTAATVGTVVMDTVVADMIAAGNTEPKPDKKGPDTADTVSFVNIAVAAPAGPPASVEQAALERPEQLMLVVQSALSVPSMHFHNAYRMLHSQKPLLRIADMLSSLGSVQQALPSHAPVYHTADKISSRSHPLHRMYK
jgi:hypothetical protein